MHAESPGWVDSAPQADPPPPTAIVITRPSSPEDSPKAKRASLSPVRPRAREVRALSDAASSSSGDTPSTASPTPTTTQSSSMSVFEQRLLAAELPPPGPDHFTSRRNLWTMPGLSSTSPTQPNTSRLRLEILLASPGALENDETWSAGLDRVWRGLVGCAKLKHRLPLALVIKILQAGWIREGTWPRGAVAPDSNDELEQVERPEPGLATATRTSEGTPIAGSTSLNSLD
ncbi:hypothetical protein C8Q79DRAFT_942915 [Trametes meyenii]|nr:hypothetical protein C8Q79DRAFT_942915 [Trametes meyenii]